MENDYKFFLQDIMAWSAEAFWMIEMSQNIILNLKNFLPSVRFFGKIWFGETFMIDKQSVQNLMENGSFNEKTLHVE